NFFVFKIIIPIFYSEKNIASLNLFFNPKTYFDLLFTCSDLFSSDYSLFYAYLAYFKFPKINIKNKAKYESSLIQLKLSFKFLSYFVITLRCQKWNEICGPKLRKRNIFKCARMLNLIDGKISHYFLKKTSSKSTKTQFQILINNSY
ncbi:hypothetical protein BpHYR1_047632, partial [Brachionus plicatilis]